MPFSTSLGAAMMRGSSLQRLFLVLTTTITTREKKVPRGQGKAFRVSWVLYLLSTHRGDKSLEEVLAEERQGHGLGEELHVRSSLQMKAEDDQKTRSDLGTWTATLVPTHSGTSMR